MADPATFLAPNSVLFPLRSACLFSYGSLYYYLINIANIKILSLNFSSRTTRGPFNQSLLVVSQWEQTRWENRRKQAFVQIKPQVQAQINRTEDQEGDNTTQTGGEAQVRAVRRGGATARGLSQWRWRRCRGVEGKGERKTPPKKTENTNKSRLKWQVASTKRSQSVFVTVVVVLEVKQPRCCSHTNTCWSDQDQKPS